MDNFHAVNPFNETFSIWLASSCKITLWVYEPDFPFFLHLMMQLFFMPNSIVVENVWIRKLCISKKSV